MAITLVALADPFAPLNAPAPIVAGPRTSHAPARIFSRTIRTSADFAGGGARQIGSLINVATPLSYGQSAWSDSKSFSGPVWIQIDLGRQILSVFRGYDEIGTSVILYGADRKPTPRGAFHILEMSRNHRSSLYDAAMPYSLRLTGDGVAIHGSYVRENAATHGCIGVPTEFSKRLFSVAHIGDLVSIN